MEPGTYITIAQLAFEGACIAVKTFRSALNFTNDAERLILGLEVERFRLHIWGENAGLAPPDGQQPTLPDRLLPLCEILKEYLGQIEQLVKDADCLSNKYGLLQTDEPPTNSALVRQLVERMQRSIKTSGLRVPAFKRTRSKEDREEDGYLGQAAPNPWLETDSIEDLTVMPLSEQRKTTTWKKFRWAVRDLDKFDNLVKDLAVRINKLNDLMTETQQRKTYEDNYRINMLVVGSAVDEASLELIRAAVRGEPDTSSVRSAVERKALTQPRLVHMATRTLKPLSLDDFVLPSGFDSLKRFVTAKMSGSVAGRLQASSYYLLERKTYDSDIQPGDLNRLTSRIQRLVVLLQKPKSPDFRTPQAEGCINDPTNSCWWTVFKFPLQPSKSPAQPEISSLRRLLLKPVSLLDLLDPTLKFRPPLEQRLTLASTLCTTLCELYLSGWLHKGVRSENILFPAAGTTLQPSPYSYSPEETGAVLSSMLVCGFDYSRHESEWVTIDKSRTSKDVDAAIYRHPNYQGEAAEGYRVQYDIYAVGLILVEIALWVSTKRAFLGAAKKTSLSRTPTASTGSSSQVQLGLTSKPATVELSDDMDSFHTPHALELRKRVTERVNSELAFRAGSRFCQAVKFCLEFADRERDGEAGDGAEVGVHPAMEFYNNVVVPLAGLSSAS
ncbi:hypothetical protein N656DRAFT_796874 [Canariomyces notabilis]|uniref:Prion-inhibition and propagation HeLo domain-containing protein n=1 Tax=Canariomyces notabilis TaxID=2074819 RepID=A0AAN6TH99_9PEZI|nr:hypothetical protein N656DRAFT_796874 [Canariomyces arenarius]